jgi:hypothetical protein
MATKKTSPKKSSRSKKNALDSDPAIIVGGQQQIRAE